MDIHQTCKRYIIQSISAVVVLSLLVLVAMNLWQLSLLAALLTSALFVLIVDVATALLWRWIATKHSNLLTSFFTGVSGFRFLLALAVMGVWYAVSEREMMLHFFVIFLVFYMVSLIHHSVFFSRVSNRS